MKKSTKVATKQARTATRVKEQRIDWKRVETVGIDLGDRFSYFCALDADGAVVAEGRVATTPGSIELHFKAASRKRIAIEAGTHSPWISRLLTRLGHEVLVANPRKLRLIYENQRKSDRVDAEYLARVARLDPKLLCALEHRSDPPADHCICI